MGLLRRAIALVIFLGATYSAIEMRSGSSSALGGIFLIPAVLVAFFALVVVIFNLPILGSARFEDSGFENTVLSPWQLKAFGIFLALLFGGAPVYIAVRGLFKGVISAPWGAPDIVLAQAPLRFVLACVVFAGAGVLLAVLIVKGIWRASAPSR
jgi:energy-converting hydrogenase Eha subunit A